MESPDKVSNASESDDEDNAGNKKEKKEKVKGKKKLGGKKKKTYDCEYNCYLQDDTNADSALF